MKVSIGVSIIGVICISGSLAMAQNEPERRSSTGAAHTIYTPEKTEWKPGPESLPKGAEMAVLTGDPTKPGPFTMRLKVPSNYKIPPHWHPMNEQVTILSGSMMLGMGETFDQSKGQRISAGSFVFIPATHRHFAWSEEEAVFQLHGTGPWGITYVNPADDPRERIPEAAGAEATSQGKEQPSKQELLDEKQNEK